MRPIDKFILYIVHNLLPLNEYGAGEVKRLIQYFKDEAEDLNIEISEDNLKKYIEQFDQLKQNLPDKEIRNYSLSKLIKLATASKGGSTELEGNITPDVVYHNENNSIIIYNGSREENCINYGRGERWCITRGSYAGYRYSETKKYPTFYLAKNYNLPDNDPLSFVAIQVRDPKETRESDRYVYTNRKNSPHESSPMSYEGLLNEVPWLQGIPDLQNILRYIPLTTKEKLIQTYKKTPTTIREWVKFPYEAKEQYLTIRSESTDNLFADISNETFIQKYLPKYPDIAYYIAITPGIISPILLLANLEFFNNQNRKSITANIQTLIPLNYLKTDDFPFEIKKLLVKLNKFDTSNEKLFISKDGSTIIKINFISSPITFDLYQEEDNYIDVKLNKRTSNYIKELDIDSISQIPFTTLIELSSEGIFENEIINKVIENAKKDKNSSIIVVEKEGVEILIDSNTFSSFKIEEGNISQIPFEDEKVQQIFNEQINNENFQKNIVKIFQKALSKSEDKSAIDKLKFIKDKKIIFKLINSIPYNKRIITISESPNVILTTPDTIFAFPTSTDNINIGRYFNYITLTLNLDQKTANIPEWRSYFAYMRSNSLTIDDTKLLNIIRSGWRNPELKKQFVEANPPLAANNNLIPLIVANTLYIINLNAPRNSYRISPTTSRVLDFNAPANIVRQAAQQVQRQAAIADLAQGAEAPGGNIPILRRRGRPAGVPNAPQQPVAQAQGDINIATDMNEQGLAGGFTTLPTGIRTRLTTGTFTPNAADRGASRRNNLLAGRGRVVRIIESGASAIYYIRLANNNIIASIVVQPGNMHYVVTANTSFRLDTPSNLVTALQARDLTESLKGIITSIYLSENPQRIKETKIILEHYINLKHPNQSTMKTSELKNLISSIINEVLTEKGGSGDPNIGEMSRKEMIEFLDMTEEEAKKYTNEELKELVIDKNSDLSEADKGTEISKKIAQRYNALTESKKRIANKFANLK